MYFDTSIYGLICFSIHFLSKYFPLQLCYRQWAGSPLPLAALLTSSSLPCFELCGSEQTQDQRRSLVLFSKGGVAEVPTTYRPLVLGSDGTFNGSIGEHPWKHDMLIDSNFILAWVARWLIPASCQVACMSHFPTKFPQSFFLNTCTYIFTLERFLLISVLCFLFQSNLLTKSGYCCTGE